MNPRTNPNRAFLDQKRIKWPLFMRPTVEKIKTFWRYIRCMSWATKIFGPQYIRSRNRIEIDITYKCNLRCYNCNRSVNTAPSNQSMTVEQIKEFIDDSVAANKKWRSIRILGGEPTLHPDFRKIITLLREYRKEYNPNCSIEVVSNGHGGFVQDQLDWIPPDIFIENTSKSGNITPYFRPFSTAPIDDKRYKYADFKNGCQVISSCGIGLGPTGYFQCTVAAGIDRVVGMKIGRKRLPSDDDNMYDQMLQTCRLCGRFKDGHFIPKDLRPDLREQLISPTWIKIYSIYKETNKDA
jgi:hypothetical protein